MPARHGVEKGLAIFFTPLHGLCEQVTLAQPGHGALQCRAIVMPRNCAGRCCGALHTSLQPFLCALSSGPRPWPTTPGRLKFQSLERVSTFVPPDRSGAPVPHEFILGSDLAICVWKVWMFVKRSFMDTVPHGRRDP